MLLGRSRPRGDERGVIMILGALTCTIVLIAASFAIDVGGRALQKRRDHQVADLAALDALRGIAVSAASVSTIASQSGTRNGFGTIGDTLTAVRGHWYASKPPGQQFVPEVETAGLPEPEPCPCDSVWVQASSTYNDFFRAGSAVLNATAIAQAQNLGSFQIGSTLASINQGLGPFGSLSMTAVGYNGLATATGKASLGALATALGLDTTVLTPDQVLASQVSVSNLLSAAASLMSATNPAASADLNTLAGAVSLAANNSFKMSLGSALSIQQGSGEAFGATFVNLLGAITGGIQIANQKAGVLAGAATPPGGLAGITGNFSATAIVPPTPPGPDGPPYPASGYATSTNTQVTVNTTLNIKDPLLGTPLGSLNISMVVGGATGTLKAVDCPNSVPTDLVVGTTFNNVQLNVTGGTILGLPITGTITVPGSAPDVTLNYPGNFFPAPPGVAVTAAGSLGTPVFSLSPAGAVLNTLLGILTPAAVDSIVSAIDTVLGNTGVHVGNADYIGRDLFCGVPKLLQ